MAKSRRALNCRFVTVPLNPFIIFSPNQFIYICNSLERCTLLFNSKQKPRVLKFYETVDFFSCNIYKKNILVIVYFMFSNELFVEYKFVWFYLYITEN
jgi:hypothetical protein